MKKTRDEYVKGLKDQLDRWNADMAKWETQAKGAQEDMKKRYATQLDTLREQRDKAAYQMKLLEGASATAWSEFTKGADEAWDRMREGVAKARAHFDKK